MSPQLPLGAGALVNLAFSIPETAPGKVTSAVWQFEKARWLFTMACPPTTGRSCVSPASASYHPPGAEGQRPMCGGEGAPLVSQRGCPSALKTENEEVTS